MLHSHSRTWNRNQPRPTGMGGPQKDVLRHPAICESAFPRSGNHRPVEVLLFGDWDDVRAIEDEEVARILRDLGRDDDAD